LKFLVDMPVTPQAVPHLEGKGHEAVHAANVGLATEPIQPCSSTLGATRKSSSPPTSTSPRLLALHKAETPGMILFRGGSYSDAAMLPLLDRVLERVSEHDLQHSITVVDQSRIRVHRLPVGD
jgi:hypothetical protein